MIEEVTSHLKSVDDRDHPLFIELGTIGGKLLIEK
jgi:hypothetical protein